METKNVVSQVKKILNKGGICEEWYLEMLENDSIENLCRMWFAGSDWSVKNDFPKLETLQQFKGKSEPFGLFTDFVGEIEPKLHQMAFFGSSDVVLKYFDFGTGQIYLRHNSKLQMYVEKGSFVELNLLDDATAEVCGQGNITIYGNKNNVKWI